MEKHREDLQHKHSREMERLRDASVRLKEEYEHKMELERFSFFSTFLITLLLHIFDCHVVRWQIVFDDDHLNI